MSLEGPLPAGDLLAVDSVFVGVVDALDDLVLEPLFEVSGGGLQPGDSVDDVDGEIEAVDLVEDGQLEWRVDVALLLVAADVDVAVVLAAVGEFVDERGVGVEVEDDGLVEGEE